MDSHQILHQHRCYGIFSTEKYIQNLKFCKWGRIDTTFWLPKKMHCYMKAVSERHARGGVKAVSCFLCPFITLNPLGKVNTVGKWHYLDPKSIFWWENWIWRSQTKDLLVKGCYFLVKLVKFYQILPNKSPEKFYQASIENFEIARNHYPKFKLQKKLKTNSIGSLGKNWHG